MKTTIRFYPSYLTKGLVALGASLALGAYALKEFALVGTETYPGSHPPARSILSSRLFHGLY